MKTLKLTFLIALLMLVGGCTAIGDNTPLETTPMVEHREQPIASPTATASATTAASETEVEPQSTGVGRQVTHTSRSLAPLCR